MFSPDQTMPRNSNAAPIDKKRDGSNEATGIGGAFQGAFRKGKLEHAKKISAFARFSLGSLIPALYMLIVGVAAYATFHHALFGLHFRTSSSVAVNGFLYLLPLFSGSALLALLLRPFFPLNAVEHKSFEMHDNNGQQVQELAEEISRRMAMEPTIELEFSLQPAVRVKPDGFLGAARHRLRLTIGLSLVAAMNSRQLGVLISHELAHYSHSGFAHIYRAMMMVDDWLTRCIEGDDGWLEKFREYEQNDENSLLVVTGLIGKTAILGNDYLLRGLYFLYETLSRPAILTLEKDADQSAVLMCGSQSFGEALELLAKVRNSWNINVQQLQNYKHVSLVDDFAGLVQKTIDKHPTVADVAESESTTAMDSLRPFAERIADARADGTRGILTLDKPSHELFRDFTGLCKRLTPIFYREIGLTFSMQDLQPVMLDDQQHRREKRLREQLDEYTSSTFFPDVVWDTACATSVAKMKDEKKLALVEESIKQFRGNLPDFDEAQTRYHDCRKKNIHSVSLVLRLKLDYVSEDLVSHQTKELQKEKSRLQRYNDILGTYSRCCGLRASCAVLLLTDSKKMLRGLQLLNHLQTLHGVQSQVLAGHLSYDLMSILYGRILEHAEIGLQKSLESNAEKLIDANRIITAVLVKLPGELKGVDELSKLLSEKVRDARGTGIDSIKQVYNEFAALVIMYKNLNQVISGQLASLASESERQRNIEPVRLIPKTGRVNAA